MNMQIAWLSKCGSQDKQLLETILAGSHSYIKRQSVSKERLQCGISLPFFFFICPCRPIFNYPVEERQTWNPRQSHFQEAGEV